MKKVWWVVVFVMVFVVAFFFVFLPANVFLACTAEAKLCPDGTNLGREPPFCRMPDCPDLIYCDADTLCPEGMGCYLLPNEERAHCIFESSSFYICHRACGDYCTFAESYPIQVNCGSLPL